MCAWKWPAPWTNVFSFEFFFPIPFMLETLPYLQIFGMEMYFFAGKQFYLWHIVSSGFIILVLNFPTCSTCTFSFLSCPNVILSYSIRCQLSCVKQILMNALGWENGHWKVLHQSITQQVTKKVYQYIYIILWTSIVVTNHLFPKLSIS